MKLRIHENSLRLRLGPLEIVRLLDTGRIEESIRFAPHENAKLTYALELSAPGEKPRLRYRPMEATVLLSRDEARRWAEGDQVGISGEVDLGQGKLELLIEKDFACVDRKDAQNQDTFPNPKAGETR